MIKLKLEKYFLNKSFFFACLIKNINKLTGQIGNRNYNPSNQHTSAHNCISN